ncbi:MAG: TolC family protein [Bacteroides sp.]|nr:TolC family protein [Bacteroides sp.]
MPYRILILAVCFPFVLRAQTGEKPLTLKEASHRMLQENPTLQIARQAVDMARNERRKLNAWWYPSLNASGVKVHLSNEISVDALLFSLPLLKRNLTTVDANVEWPLFTGGRRVWASRIGSQMVRLAQTGSEETAALLQTELVEAYYGLRLSTRVEEVRREAYHSLKRHYEDALKLEANGMATKAERLFAQVSMEEARREWESAGKERGVAEETLRTLLGGANDSLRICPSSPLFLSAEIPPLPYFKSLIATDAYAVSKLRVEEAIAHNRQKISRSAYLPTVALFGKHTLYANNLPRHLMPRTLVGIGFTWNLFDGWNREADVRLAGLSRQSLTLGRKKAEDELTVGVDKLYSQLEDAQDEVRTLATTIEMSRELVRIRRQSFAEGMATGSEVIDAEVMLSKVRIAMLAAYYQFDVALASLCSLCGVPELFWELMENSPQITQISTD